MDVTHGENPGSFITLHFDGKVRPIAATCPSSLGKAIPDAARTERDISEITLFPKGNDAAFAYTVGGDLRVAFLQWKKISNKGTRNTDRGDKWVVDDTLTHPKFKQRAELTLQLYPNMEILQLRDAGREFVAGTSPKNELKKIDDRFPGAVVVDIAELLNFAVSNEAHFEPAQ